MDRRRITQRFTAGLLIFAVVFLSVSILSFEPADPPSSARVPANRPVQNWAGPVGAWIAYLAAAAVGHGIGVVLVAAAGAAIALWRHRPIDDLALRIVGVVLVLGGFCAFCARTCPALLSPLPVGSGGYVGMAAAGFLEQNFSGVGTYLILLATLATGLLLWADSLILAIATRFRRGVRDLLRPVPMPRPARPAGRPTVPEPVAPPPAAVEAAAPGPSEPAGADQPVTAPPPPDPIIRRHVEMEPEPAAAEPDDQAEAASEDPGQEVIVPEAPEPAEEAVAADTSSPPIRTAMQEAEADMREIVQSDEPYVLPGIDLLDDPEPFPFEVHERQVREKAAILEKTFRDFGLTVRVVAIDTGPVITQFEVALEAGLRVNRVLNLDRDLAIALKAPSVRVVAPLPGKNTVGIEVPNAKRAIVRMKEVIRGAGDTVRDFKLPLFIGKDASGNPLVCDLTDLPHLLMAGRTGSGKSVCINAMIMSLLLTQRPQDVRMLMVDPKMVELAAFKKIPHLMCPLVTDMKKAEAVLAWAVSKMDERYDLLARAGVRSIAGYNRLGPDEIYRRFNPQSDEERVRIPERMPYIVIIIDELADLMMTSGKEVELYVTRLAQKSRAVGIHLILATQRPSVDVITGLIKSNLPARLSFNVASRVDSRTILDEMGAEKLLGNGDMLFTMGGGRLIRAQGSFVSEAEIKRVVAQIETRAPAYDRELVQIRTDSSEVGKPLSGSKRDELYDAAVKVVIMNQRGSVSLLQRALEIGYSRAARLIDMMAEDGIVGDYQGSQAREVLFTPEEWEALEKERHKSDQAA